MHQAERGLFDLRQGRPLYVTVSDEAGAFIAPVDGLVPAALEALCRVGPVRLVVTSPRALSMGLVPTVEEGARARAFSLALNGEDPAQIVALACARQQVEAGGYDVRPAGDAEQAGVTLARVGHLLPAVVSALVDASRAGVVHEAVASGAALSVSAAQVDAWAGRHGVRVTYVSEGPVPLAATEEARFVVFREAGRLLEHVAVLIGRHDAWPDPVPVRIHSACLTGDLFGSLRCDCGEQLRGSVKWFAEQGGGVLLYMLQEGRDIGLGNKLRAYALQESGLDTIDADGTLGFGADERRYGAAVEMLKLLDITRVQLLTNNPEKLRAVRDGGIDVVDRRPLYGTLNRHNLPYVKAKVERAGHWLTDMLSGALSFK